MSTYHINDSGTITAPYDTWAKAAQFLSTPSKANDDQFLLDSTHQESYSATTTFTFITSDYRFNSIISGVPDSPSGLASASQGAKLITTTGYSIRFNGSVYTEGVVFELGGGTSLSTFTASSTSSSGICHQIYKDCIFRFLGATNNSGIYIGESSISYYGSNRYDFVGVTIKTTTTWQGITVYTGDVLFEGLSYEAGSSAAVQLVAQMGVSNHASNCRITFSACDFSSAASSLALVGLTYGRGEIIFKNCKLPASWSGTIASSLLSYGVRVALYNCDSGSANYIAHIKARYGTIDTETTIVRTNGAYDGATQISWKVYAISTKYPVTTMDLDPIIVWNTVTGSSITATIEIITDTATALTDADIWMEIEYLGNSSYPVSTVVSTKPSSMITTASDLPSSSATWTTTGLSTPLKQKLSLSFTPQMVGFVSARVKLAKTTATVYVCPKLDLT